MISSYSNAKLYDVINAYANEVISLYREKLDANNKNCTGNLYNHLDFVISENDTDINVYLYMEDYAKFVEKGTKPHFPPINAIEEWIVHKPIVPYPDSKGKLPTVKQLAFLIARKISQVGTEGGNYLEITVKELEDKYAPLIQQAIDEDCSNWVMQNIDSFFE